MTKLFVHIAGIDNNLEKADRIAFLQKMFSDVYQIKEENIILINDKKYGGYRNFQFAEIEGGEEDANKIIEALKGTTYEGYEIAINIAKPLEESSDRRPSFNRGGNSGGFNRGGGFGGGSNRSNGSDRPSRSYNDDSRGYRN